MLPQFLSRAKLVPILLFHGGLTLGLLGGLQYHSLLPETSLPPHFIDLPDKRVATLHLDGIFGGTLYAQTGPLPIRLLVQQTSYELTPNKAFSLPLTLLDGPPKAKEVEVLDTPCLFLAGQSGSYVYLKGDPKAMQLKTPRCFERLEDAEQAGLEFRDYLLFTEEQSGLE